MPRTFSHMRTALVLFSAGLVLTTCLVGAWVWLDLRSTLDVRTNTRLSLLHWQRVYSSLRDVETGARGYVLTGDALYLRPFNDALDRLPRLLVEAPTIESRLEHGLSIEEIESIQRLIQGFLAAKQEIISVADREGRESAVELMKQGHAKRHMDALRKALDDQQLHVEQELRQMDAEMETALTLGGRALLTLIAAALVASGAAAALLRHAVVQARRNERLAQEKQQSDRANREKSVFLATMSHEIRTPMNAILGFGELLLGDARDEKQSRYAGSIVRSGHALLQLINDILDFSKIEAGMIEITHDPVDVRELADFTRQLFAHQCAEKGVRLEIEVEDWVPGSLLLDAARLRQILINLVGNAVKFTHEGTIWLRFRGTPPVAGDPRCHLLVEVSDTGIGIPADRLEQIFDPFVQAKASQDTATKGTGLGLAIVRRLTQLMGGIVTVRSEEGKGSTFIVELPGVEISSKLAATATEQAESSVDFNDLRASTIFVVDDNPENLSVLQGYFDGTHHRVATASNGREALQWLERNPQPDVVLMDIRMPVLDGRATLNEIRKKADFRLLPVLAVTASSLAHEEDDLRAAFDSYVRKPFTRAQLHAELSQFIPPAPPAPAAVTKAPESLNGSAPETWKPLVERLRILEHTVWPTVRDGMVMSEVIQFAADLKQLAADSACPPLDALANRIHTKAETFSLDALERELNSFPAFISHIEQRLPLSAP